MSAVVGLSVFHADAAAAALVDGAFVAGIEEERLRRVKHWAGYPEQALRFAAHVAAGDDSRAIERFAVARQPRAHLARKVALALGHPRSLLRAASRARNLGEVASLGERIASSLGLPRAPELIAVEHHLAHLASAFYPSPFEAAACLSIDGFGDFVSTMSGVGRGRELEIFERVHFPHSLGIFYTALTQYLGFPHFGDEYKVMGLAAYGEPRFAAEIRSVIPGTDDGGFALDLDCFRHLSEGVAMTWEGGAPELGVLFTPRLEERLGPARRSDTPLADRHRDLAASIQAVYEERFFALVRRVVARANCRDLVLAGGCAQNSLANGRLIERGLVDRLFVQPAAGDSGTALGAALWTWHGVLGRPRLGPPMASSAFGPDYSEAEIRRALAVALPESNGCDGRFGELEVRTAADDDTLCRESAQAIEAGDVVGWFQGPSEWGPRALGYRSILADPRRADMKERLNAKIKRRESFRPFAPSILEERTGDWFTAPAPDPFMTRVVPFRPEKRELVPAVVHVDGSGRLQTVSAAAHPLYHRLISAFEELTGVPIVLNTSFNENEPIVESPAQALDCFLRTRMDRLAMGRVVVRRVE